MSNCVTCGEPVTTPFCPRCGERRFDPHALSLKHFFEHAFEAFVHFDGTILQTLRRLAFSPGGLTAEWVAGRRKRWLAPVQLLLVMNMLYFVSHAIAPWNTLTTELGTHMNGTRHAELATSMVNEKLAQRGVSLADYRLRFDAKAELQAKSLVIVMVPVLAIAVALLHARSARFFSVHLVFSTHFYGFFLLYLSVLSPVATGVLKVLARAGITASGRTVDDVVSFLFLGVIAVYLAAALGTVYRQARWIAIPKAILLTYAVLQILHLYRFALFLVTFTST